MFARVGSELGLEVFFNFIVAAGEKRLRLQSYEGISPETAAGLEWLDFGQAVCGTVAATRARRIEEHVQTSGEPLCDLIRSLGIRAYACFPLRGRQRLIGTLSFGTRERDTIDEPDLELLERISDVVALRLDLAQVMEELSVRTRELESTIEEKDEFIGMIAHELKNPLAVVRGGASLLLEKERLLSEDRHELTSDIARHADRALDVIEKLLIVSRARVESSLALEPIEVGRLAKRVVEEFRDLTPARPVRLTGERRCIAAGVETYVAEILRNLLSNADKYSPPGAPIELSLSSEADECVVRVRDHGPGVDPRHLGQIFRRFYRSPATSDSAEGSGLGLTLCRRLVEAQGGRIEANLPEDGGLEVLFTVPLYEDVPVRESASEPPFVEQVR
jgi:signal transduction histidine kinase